VRGGALGGQDPADSGAGRIDLSALATTVGHLRLLKRPPAIGRGSPRQPGEFATYRVKVRLSSFKLEGDSDIHLVVSDPTNAAETMIIEFPVTACVTKAGTTSRAKMSRARRALIAACGPPGSGSFRSLSGTATITGVAFFDVIDDQRGVAPNGIELHPVLRSPAPATDRVDGEAEHPVTVLTEAVKMATRTGDDLLAPPSRRTCRRP
jgi:hypothetical protein